MQCAKSAQKNWAALTLEERANWLHKIADKMQENIEEIARLESLDTGKPWDVALNVDASRSVNNFRFFADFSKNIDELKFEMDDASNYVLRKPWTSWANIAVESSIVSFVLENSACAIDGKCNYR